MFRAEPWADAFLRAMPAEAAGQNENAFEALKRYCRAALMIPGEPAGTTAAGRLAKVVGRALEKAGYGAPDSAAAGARYAGDFFLLMVRKGRFREYKKIISRIRERMDKNNGTVRALLETPFEPDAGFIELVKQRLRKKTNAREIVICSKIIPELIGGFRVRMGSVLLDGSLKTRLVKMASKLGREN
ncbi:MAG: F0F1 ATP synthase subunit delta [Treponema sp.]|jgi:F-type H+-transporting ATPase subunit delta|nr:F0F1 ATP synthase subunit delta [Treponema sp.]